MNKWTCMCFKLKPIHLPITLQPPSMPFKMTLLISFRQLWAFILCVQCVCGSAVLALCSSIMYVLFKCLFCNANNHHFSYFSVVKDDCFCISSELDTGGFFVSLCCVRLWCLEVENDVLCLMIFLPMRNVPTAYCTITYKVDLTGWPHDPLHSHMRLCRPVSPV